MKTVITNIARLAAALALCAAVSACSQTVGSDNFPSYGSSSSISSSSTATSIMDY